MALKRTLVQEEYLMISTGSDPATGYLSFYPKADGNFYKRTSAGVETKLWDSTNDGTGSGLDADLLDGYHASDFQLAITNPITGTGTANYIPKFTSASQLGNSVIYETGGKIGIGATAPDYTLDVAGIARATAFRGSLNSSAYFIAHTNSAAQGIYLQTNGGATTGLFVQHNGNVGIGTTAPSVALDVNGQIQSRSATGTAPFVIASTTLVSKLNADLLDGQHGSYYTGYVQARGMNLVSNGSGLMGSNYNFSSATYDQTDVHGGLGSFAKSTGPASLLSDEYIPVDVGKYYIQSIWAKAGDDGGVNYTPLNIMHIGISERDIDGNNIGAEHAIKHSTAVDTELATALNIGDTVVNLVNGTGWTLNPNHFVWFPYTNSKGYTYPLYGYSRNYTRFLRSEYNSGAFTAINGNVLTLAAPWPGPALAAGTPLRQCGIGAGTYKYFYTTVYVPNSWTNYKTTIRPALNDYQYSATRFYNGTAYIQILILFNYGSEKCIQRISDVWFSEISANNLDAFQVPIVSSVATGTAPLTIASTTLNTNLNADLLDGYHASDFQLALTNPVTGTGTTNYIPKFTAANQLGNSIIYETGGKIGIGTTAPGSRFHLSDDGLPIYSNLFNITIGVNAVTGLYFNDSSVDNRGLIVVNSKIGTTGNRVTTYWTFGNANGNNGDQGWIAQGVIEKNSANETIAPTQFKGWKYFYHDGSNYKTPFVLSSNGNIGIGTTAPSVALDVNGQIRSRSATGTAPLVIASNTLVSNLNADLLDGLHKESFILNNDSIFDKNLFTSKHLYRSDLDDAMFLADVRWVVSGKLYNKSDDSFVSDISSLDLSYLFNGNYEHRLIVPAGQYAIINIKFTTETNGLFPGFPYGTFYATHYYTYHLESFTAKVYCNYEPQGVGWKTLTTYDVQTGTQTYVVGANNQYYQISEIEFIIAANDSNSASIASLEWKLNRPSVQEFPVVVKWKENILYKALTFSANNNINIRLNPNGSASFSGQLTSTAPTGTAPFVIASTTLNTNLNADLLDGYHASAFALAGSGVTSFNTRTGAVTLSKADVEGVLTGLITSHTHNYTNNTGTVTSVAMTVPTGLAIAGSPITTSGTLALSFASGYSIPTTAKQTQWDTAYTHSQAAHQTIIDGTGFVKANGTTLSYDTSTYALNTHTHTQYVNKTGDTMSGNLSITKVITQSFTGASYHLAAQNAATYATQAWFEIGSSDASGTTAIRSIRTDNGIATEYNLINTVVGTSKTITVGDGDFEYMYLGGPAIDVIGNISHVLCYGTTGVKKIPVGDFSSGGGSAYVLKAGDTMTGNLLIHKTNSGSVTAQFGIKADATSGRYHEFRITSLSEADVYETSLQMITPTPTNYPMLGGSIVAERGSQLFLGGLNWDALSIYAATDVIGNASCVYVSDTSGNVKLVPVSSFGGGSGTVTSVGLSMPNIFSVSNSPVTTSGTLTATLVSQTKNHVFAAPQSANGVPTFRKLTADDMPDLSAMYDNYYCWNVQVKSGTTSQVISAAQTPSTGQYKGIRFLEGTGIKLSETNVSGILNLSIAADSSGADNYEAWTLKYSVDGVPTSIPINSINSSGTYRAVRFGGSDIDILPQSESGNTMALLFKVKITPLEAVLTSNYGLTSANSDYNVLTVSNVPAGTYLAVVDILGYHSTPSNTCTIVHRLRSSTGTNYLSTAVGNITGVNYRKGNMSGIITLTGTTTLYLTCRSTITGNSIYAACGYGNNATRITLIKIA